MGDIEITDLCVTFPTEEGAFRALKDVSVTIRNGERVAIIGESGCGKSVLGHSIMKLLDDISDTTGTVLYNGKDIRKMSEREIVELRGETIALLPQSPGTSFDPVMRIGKQADEVRIDRGHDKKVVRKDTLDRLADVGFEDPKKIYDTFPHRLSGGMCERALMVMSTAFNPDVLIADEPTKGLDPVSKKEIIRLLYRLTENKTLIMITHDYNAARMCERTVVMYAGRILEDGPTDEVLNNPRHPYTKALWGSLPSKGMHPIPKAKDGIVCKCEFAPRCPKYSEGTCDAAELVEVSDKHFVRCPLA